MKNELRSKKTDLKINAFFNNLPKWDRKNHIGNLSKYITVCDIEGIEKQDAKELLEMWLMQFCMQEPRENAKYKKKLTIIGGHYIGKSVFCDWLLAEIPLNYGHYWLNTSNTIWHNLEGSILIVKAFDFTYKDKIDVLQVWAEANENKLPF